MVAHRCFPEIGGVESHVEEVAGRLAARGYELEVLTTDRSGSLPRTERVPAGDRSYVVRRYRAFPRERDWYVSPGLFWALLTGRHRLVHVQGVHTLVPPLAMLAAWLRRVPYLLTFHSGGHSSAFRERSRGMQWRLLAPLLRRASALVGVSLYERRRFNAAIGDDPEDGRIQLVRNGGSLPALSIAPEPDLDLVVSIGRLERYKGHHRAIEALPVLARTRPGIRLEILGSGAYESELLALAERLGVSDRVSIRFIPPPDRAEMARSLAKAGVVVLLSDYEAHPVSVMEALVVGRPVVVALTSGLTELTELDWARGVDLGPSGEGDPEQIAAALAEQLESPLLPDVAELPTWEGCVSALEDVYARLADPGRRLPA
ncbi:glycosyltransferase family 4 protein [Nocardioides sp. CBS4Y-1]|uniref:Glycosyltransferase family 4 protein n=2 Tax=Nocardioides acrostichi TaxID=2784339 RepID=A0A930Y7H3_9ACTN|nr:glycosyltransferase family 4 protein [Nocardioides acrostichi]